MILVDPAPCTHGSRPRTGAQLGFSLGSARQAPCGSPREEHCTSFRVNMQQSAATAAREENRERSGTTTGTAERGVELEKLLPVRDRPRSSNTLQDPLLPTNPRSFTTHLARLTNFNEYAGRCGENNIIVEADPDRDDSAKHVWLHTTPRRWSSAERLVHRRRLAL